MANPALEISEKTWQSQVVTIAKQLGWHGIYHPYDSRRSTSGVPDLLLVRERVVYIELKSESGKLSAAQRKWIAWLLHAGAETYVARPSDLEAVGAILGPRGGANSPLAAQLSAKTQALLV